VEKPEDGVVGGLDLSRSGSGRVSVAALITVAMKDICIGLGAAATGGPLKAKRYPDPIMLNGSFTLAT
jgi:hypothetical protein